MEQEAKLVLCERLKQLERRVRVLQAVFLFSLTAIVAMAFAARSTGSPQGDQAGRILRVRGLVVEDEHGRARVLLGAPVTSVDGRKRQDAATGLVVLGENGADRVLVGYMPDPQVAGKVHNRIASGVGIQINDHEGNERAGFSFMNNGRVVLGLDYPNREAVTLSVLPDLGFAGLIVNAEQGSRSERAEIGVFKDGTSLMKLADTTGLERAILIVRGESLAQLLIVDPKDKSALDVLARLKP